MTSEDGGAVRPAVRWAASLAGVAVVTLGAGWVASRPAGGPPDATGAVAPPTTRTVVPGSVAVAAADGSWAMEAGPAWRPAAPPAGAGRAWAVGPRTAPVADTVTVTAAPGPVAVEAAIAAERARREAAGQTVSEDVERFTAPDGHAGAVLTFADPAGAAPARGEVVLHVGPGRLVTVAVVAQDDRADEAFLALRPFALSVRFPRR